MLVLMEEVMVGVIVMQAIDGLIDSLSSVNREEIGFVVDVKNI